MAAGFTLACVSGGVVLSLHGGTHYETGTMIIDQLGDRQPQGGCMILCLLKVAPARVLDSLLHHIDYYNVECLLRHQL